MENNYTVYMHISPSGKRYIGITSMKPEYRWKKGKGYPQNKHFTNAINKYGWDNFQHIIITKGLSEEQAKTMEIKLIAEYDSTNREKGYNKSLGGESGNCSEETRKKMSENAKERFKNKENHPMYGKGYLMSRENNPMYGKKRPEISERMSGKNNPMYGRCGELNPMYGKNHTEEAKKKMSENHANNSGENHPNYGKHLSEETKKKISEANKGHKHTEEQKQLWSEQRKGENNPMYGKKRPEMSDKNNPNAKSIICITTGKIFNTQKEGAEYYGIKSYTSISHCCRGKQKSCGKYNGTPLVWKYITIIEL